MLARVHCRQLVDHASAEAVVLELGPDILAVLVRTQTTESRVT